MIAIGFLIKKREIAFFEQKRFAAWPTVAGEQVASIEADEQKKNSEQLLEQFKTLKLQNMRFPFRIWK